MTAYVMSRRGKILGEQDVEWICDGDSHLSESLYSEYSFYLRRFYMIRGVE